MNNDYINRYTGESKRSSGKMVSHSPPRNAVVAQVRSHLDSTFMGSLQVQLVDNSSAGNIFDNPDQLFVAHYLAPFYGVTPLSGVQDNSGDQYTQKSYGMWFVPPDIGSLVLVIFAESGDAYWIGCIPEKDTNFMTPAGDAATTYNTQSNSEKKPVAEINKIRRLDAAQGNATKIPKPIHANIDQILSIKGLAADETRGITTSSARREVPSAVFGVSTPGPYDRRQGAPRVKYGNAQVFHNRLGGSSIVMDDGDASLLRKSPASTGPSEYADIKKDETGGDVTIPHNEMLRLKTRTGHQILMHNSEDLIYIGNAKGNTWIELTANGKIDIYAEDSISIHTENDLNFRAERDINLEAGRDVNFKAKNNAAVESENNFQLIVGNNNKITTKGVLDISTQGNNNLTSEANTEIKTKGDHIESTGGKIKMNGPEATEAEKAIALTTWDMPAGDSTVNSIMRRIPQHEPWLQHENLAPLNFTPTETDIKKLEERRGQGITPFPPNSGEYKPTADTFRRGA